MIERSSTAKDSRMVCRCCGGIDERASFPFILVVVVWVVEMGFGNSYEEDDDGSGRPKLGRAVVGVETGESNGEGPERKLLLLSRREGRGDLVGLDCESEGAVVPRVVIHERSSAPAAAGWGLNERDGVEEAKFGVDCFNGEPWGVPARMVDGERPSGDSGLRKGDARPLVKDRGAGLRGDDGFD